MLEQKQTSLTPDEPEDTGSDENEDTEEEENEEEDTDEDEDESTDPHQTGPRQAGVGDHDMSVKGRRAENVDET